MYLLFLLLEASVAAEDDVGEVGLGDVYTFLGTEVNAACLVSQLRCASESSCGARQVPLLWCAFGVLNCLIAWGHVLSLPLKTAVIWPPSSAWRSMLRVWYLNAWDHIFSP